MRILTQKLKILIGGRGERGEDLPDFYTILSKADEGNKLGQRPGTCSGIIVNSERN